MNKQEFLNSVIDEDINPFISQLYMNCLRNHEVDQFNEVLTECEDLQDLFIDLVNASYRGSDFLLAELQKNTIKMFEEKLIEDLRQLEADKEVAEYDEDKLNRELFDRQEASSINRECVA